MGGKSKIVGEWVSEWEWLGGDITNRAWHVRVILVIACSRAPASAVEMMRPSWTRTRNNVECARSERRKCVRTTSTVLGGSSSSRASGEIISGDGGMACLPLIDC